MMEEIAIAGWSKVFVYLDVCFHELVMYEIYGVYIYIQYRSRHIHLPRDRRLILNLIYTLSTAKQYTL